MSDMQFTRAERKKAQGRIMLSGPSGSGKTYGSLILATTVARLSNTRLAVVDTEHDSASLYADKFDFDRLNLKPPFTPERYIEAMAAAANAGFGALLIDSATHEWSGPGGILEIVDSMKKTSKNQFAPWADATPRHNKFIDAMLRWPGHLFITARSKTEWTLDDKNKPQKVGMAPVQREGLEYEFTSAIDVSIEGNLCTVSKTREDYAVWSRDPFVISDANGEALFAWLESGVDQEQIITDATDAAVEGILKAKSLGELREKLAAAVVRWRELGTPAEMNKRITEAKDRRKAELEAIEGNTPPEVADKEKVDREEPPADDEGAARAAEFDAELDAADAERG